LHFCRLASVRATVGTVALVESFAPCVILTSDGDHSVLTEEAITEIVRGHDSDPHVCAQALVTAAREASPSDDATAAVIVRSAPVHRGDALEGR
jgi:serine/threonine protein phosphatase PrpC